MKFLKNWLAHSNVQLQVHLLRRRMAHASYQFLFYFLGWRIFSNDITVTLSTFVPHILNSICFGSFTHDHDVAHCCKANTIAHLTEVLGLTLGSWSNLCLLSKFGERWMKTNGLRYAMPRERYIFYWDGDLVIQADISEISQMHTYYMYDFKSVTYPFVVEAGITNKASLTYYKVWYCDHNGKCIFQLQTLSFLTKGCHWI